MPPFDPYDDIQDILNDPAAYGRDIHARLEVIAKYPTWKQNTFLVLAAEGMISNGGTPAIFYNDGCIVPRTIEAYDAVGAIDHAGWLRKLAALFGDPYPIDLDTINDGLTETPEDIWDESSKFFHDDHNWNKILHLLEDHCPHD